MKYKYALIRSILGSGNSTVSKLVMMYLPVYPVLFVRYLGGFFLSITEKSKRNEILQDLILLKREKKTRNMFLISLLLTGFNVLVFYYIINNLPLTISTIFVNGSYVVVSVILGRIFLKEIKTKRTYIYIGITVAALAGYILLGSNDKVEVGLIGILIMLVNAVGSSVETLLSAINLKTLKSSTVVAGKMSSNALVALIFLIISKQPLSAVWKDLTLYLFIGMMFLIFSGVIVKILEYKSIEVIGTGETAVFGVLSFVFGAIISMIVFKEWLNVWQYIALIVIIVSLYLIKKYETGRGKNK